MPKHLNNVPGIIEIFQDFCESEKIIDIDDIIKNCINVATTNSEKSDLYSVSANVLYEIFHGLYKIDNKSNIKDSKLTKFLEYIFRILNIPTDNLNDISIRFDESGENIFDLLKLLARLIIIYATEINPEMKSKFIRDTTNFVSYDSEKIKKEVTIKEENEKQAKEQFEEFYYIFIDGLKDIIIEKNLKNEQKNKIKNRK